jgi:hypothetical protein
MRMGCGWRAANLGASDDHSRLDRMFLLMNVGLGIADKRVVPGELLRQQHKEHDTFRPHILSHIGNCDLQESHNNNDRCTNIVVKRKLCRHVPHGAVAKPRRLAVCLCHPKVTYAGSMIRINHILVLDVSVDDALGVQVCQGRNTWRRIRSSRTLLVNGCKQVSLSTKSCTVANSTRDLQE